MGTYKNDFDPKSDYMMWELHEIRNKLYLRYKNDCTALNRIGKKVYNEAIGKKSKSNNQKKAS